MNSIFMRNGDFKTFFKTAPVTSVIIIINTLMLLITLITGGFGVYNLVELGALAPILIKNGDYWRIITSAFLHGSVIHYLGNIVIGLLSLSSALERMIGSKKFTFIYFGSMILSGIAVTAFSVSNVITVGASGAIFGSLGCLLYIILYRKDLITQRDAQSITSLIVINIIFTFVYPSISIYGHLGGIIGGFLLSFLVIRRNVYKVIN